MPGSAQVASGRQPVAETGRNQDGSPPPSQAWAFVALLATAVMVPTGIFALGAWLAWGQVWEQVRAELAATAGAAAEYAARVLDGHALLADRVDELLRGQSDAQIRDREPDLHRALHQLSASRPIVRSLRALDAQGRLLAASNVFPVQPDRSTEEDDFFEQLRDADRPGPVISRVYRSRLDGELSLAVAERRGAAALAGVSLVAGQQPFRGAVLVSLRPGELALGLQRLADTTDQTIALIRTDGEVLARSSGFEDPPPALPPDSPFRQIMASGAERALTLGRTGTGGDDSLIAFRRVAGWPVVATVTEARGTVVARWRRVLLWQASFGAPAILTLVGLVVLAVRRTRQVAEARAALRSEAERREAAEALRESDERYRALAGATREGVAIHDGHRIVEANDAFWRMFGYASRQAVLGRNPLEFVSPVARKEVQEAFSHRHSEAYESTGLRSDGTSFPVGLHGEPILYQGRPMRVEVVRNLTVQKAAERTLRDMLGTLDLGAFMARDLDGTIRYWSAGSERLFGWTSEEAVGRISHALLRTVFPTPLPEIEATLERSGEWTGEVRQLTRSGQEVAIATRKALRRDAEGQPTGVVESMVDVTPVRRAQAELLDRSLRLQLLSDTAGRLLAASEPEKVLEELFQSLSEQLSIDISFSCVMDGHTEEELRLAATFGIPEEARVGLKRLRVEEVLCGAGARSRAPIRLEALQASWNPAADVIRGLGVRAYVAFPLMAGDRLIGTLSFGTRRRDRFPDEDLALLGTIARYVGVLRERLHAEAALRGAEQRLRSIVETIQDGMVVIDERGTIVSFSAAAERLFGWPAEEALGRNVSTLMPSPDRERHDAYIGHYLATGERRIIGKGRVVTGMRRDGSTFPMELTIGEVRSGSRYLFTGFVRDLTERQEAERRLQELQSELLHVSRVSAAWPMS